MVCPQVGDGIMVQPKALAPLQFPHSIPQASPIVPQNASFEARDKVAAKPDSRIARHAARRNVGVHQKESIFDLIVYLAVPSLLCRLDRRGLDRQSVVAGKSVSVRVDLGGRRIIEKQNSNK